MRSYDFKQVGQKRADIVVYTKATTAVKAVPLGRQKAGAALIARTAPITLDNYCFSINTIAQYAFALFTPFTGEKCY